MNPDDQHHCCSACSKDRHCTHGLWTTWYQAYDQGVRNANEFTAAETALVAERKRAREQP